MPAPIGESWDASSWDFGAWDDGSWGPYLSPPPPPPPPGTVVRTVTVAGPCACCDTGTGTSTGTTGDCDCDCCPTGYRTAFTISVSTIVDDGLNCTSGECLPINGDWTLSYRGNCLWDTGDSYTLDCGAAPSTEASWTLECVPATGTAGSYWRLRPVDLAYYYELSDPTGTGEDVCFDGGVFSLVATGVNTQCAGYPSTITVVPAGLRVECDEVEVPCCPGTLPRIVYATVSSSCATFDDITIALEFDDVEEHWIGTASISCGGCTTMTVTVYCDGPTLWVEVALGPIPACTFSYVDGGFVTSSCVPFYAEWSSGVIGGPCCTGDTFTVVVTR